MEQFRLRIRVQPKRGQIWELHLFPHQPRRQFREVDGRVLGSSSSPEGIYWLRQVAEPYLVRAEAPEPIQASDFGPNSEPRWLQHEDGMRLALAFSSARWLVKRKHRTMFLKGLRSLPSEVVLYWFTLCFYGYQQAAGRAALRTLLTHEEPTEEPRSAVTPDEESQSYDMEKAGRASIAAKQSRLIEAQEALGEFSARLKEQKGQKTEGAASTAGSSKKASPSRKRSKAGKQNKK